MGTTPRLSERMTDAHLDAIVAHFETQAIPRPVLHGIVRAFAELRAYRAGEIVPEGKAQVDVADWRALVDIAANSMEACPLCPIPVTQKEPLACEPQSASCRAALLARAGLAPKETADS